MGTIYIGDIHGNFDFVNWYVKAHQISDCAMVQVGDFGIGFRPDKEVLDLKKLDKTLKESETTLYVLRGNHDNPAYFDGTFNEYERIIFVPDYSVIMIGGKNHLFVGGAISIDRKLRVNGESYWKNEPFVLDEDKLKTIKGIDVLVTHNSMSFLPPLSIDRSVVEYGKDDPGLIDELIFERLQMTRMWDILTAENGNEIGLHLYGHFHSDETIFINNTKHLMLGINKTYEHRY